MDLGTAPLDSKTASQSRQGTREKCIGSAMQSVVADFNGDGFPDVATANAVFGPSTVAVFLGKANGEFQSISIPMADRTSGIVAEDFNNDGILDPLP